jgi:ABC-type branched-subunit amino acid transport system permease subunit
LDNLLVGLVLGAFGSFSKVLVNYYITSLLSLNANILLAGIGVAGTVHLVFGGIGGVIAAVVLNRVKLLHFPRSKPSEQKKPETLPSNSKKR